MYGAKSSMGGPSFPFGSDSRDKDPRNLSPGPGAYDSKDNLVKTSSA